MRNIWRIMKKELSRVFTNKKLIFSVFILPGVFIFGIYSLMGSAMSGLFTPNDITVYEVGLPDEISTIVNSYAESFEITYLSDTDTYELAVVKEMIINKELDFAIYFEDGIITYYYKSVSTTSSQAREMFLTAVSAFDDNKVLINGIEFTLTHDHLFDLSTEEEGNEAISMQVTAILPMLIMIFLFQGALSFGPESIAGDKERGTIATLLATPTKRSEIALGKIFSLSILATLASLSSFLGIMLSLPKLMGGASGMGNIQLSYGLSDYLAILALLVVTVLVIIGVVSIISAYASNVKEATSYSAPFMIVTMILGLSNMFMTSEPSLGMFFVPIYNVVQMLNMILASKFNLTYFLITIIINIGVATFLSYILTILFKSEKIMFSK